MESDVESFHNESKFYYPDKESSKEILTNVGRGKVSPLENNAKQIQEFIEQPRAVNTRKKTS